MDPISVISLVATAGEVADKLFTFGRLVKDAAFERAQLQSELFGLKAALEHVALIARRHVDSQKEPEDGLSQAEETRSAAIEVLERGDPVSGN